MNERPGETTTLLKRLCTGAWQRFPVDRVLKAKPEEFIHIYVQKKEKLMEFLEHMIRVWEIHNLIVLVSYMCRCRPSQIVLPSFITRYLSCIYIEKKPANR